LHLSFFSSSFVSLLYSLLSSLLFFLMFPPPPRSTLFPYTTLFRSYTVGPLHQINLPLFFSFLFHILFHSVHHYRTVFLSLPIPLLFFSFLIAQAILL